MSEKGNNAGFGRRLLAALLAAVAARAALKLLEGVWTKGAGRALPDEAEESSISEKVVWVALAAAAVAAARELTKEIVNPSTGARLTGSGNPLANPVSRASAGD